MQRIRVADTVDIRIALVVGLVILILAPPAAASEHAAETMTADVSKKPAMSTAGFNTLASRAGAVLNSNLLRGGGADDTRILQRVLDGAANDRPVHLMINGPALVSGLDVYGNTTIECSEGGGLYLKDGSDRAVLRNAHRSRGVAIDEHITVRGCFLNGNRNRQLHREPEDGRNQETDGTFLTGLQFLGVNYLTVENMILWNMRSFGVWIANAQYVDIKNVQVDNGSPQDVEKLGIAEQAKLAMTYLQTDGVHFNGPIRYLSINGLKLRTGDDALAFNANDMGREDMTVSNDMGPYVGQGPITDVSVTNVALLNAALGIRLLSLNQRVDRILIDNVTGTTRGRMAVLGHFVTPTPTGNFGSVMFNNVSVDAIKMPSVEETVKVLLPTADMEKLKREHAEDWDGVLFALNSPIESLSLQHIMTNIVDGRPIIWVGGNSRIVRMSVDLSANDPGLQAVPLKLERGGRIEWLSFSLDWKGDALDSGKNPILYNGGVVNQLHWVNTPPTYVKAKLTLSDPSAVTVTFSESVKAADFRKGVAINVNGSSVHVLEAVRQPSGDAVRYRIGTAVAPEDSATWAYDASVGTIQNWDGDNMLSVAAKRIRMSQ